MVHHRRRGPGGIETAVEAGPDVVLLPCHDAYISDPAVQEQLHEVMNVPPTRLDADVPAYVVLGFCAPDCRPPLSCWMPFTP